MAPPQGGYPLGMPPESGGIPGRNHIWEVPFALMLSPGWMHKVPAGAAAPRRGQRPREVNPYPKP